VEVTVPLTVTVEGWMDLDGWENAVVMAGRQAMAAARQALLTAATTADEAQRCPRCDAAAERPHDTRQRVILTSFGRVVVAYRRHGCRACGARTRPATALACLRTGNTTAALRQAAVWAGSSWPFATAARLLGELLGAVISPEQVRLVTLGAGRQVADDQRALARAVVTPTGEAVRAARARASTRTRHGSRSVLPPPAPPQLLMGLDGGWVASREQPGGMEGKVGVVATGIVIRSPTRQALAPRQYVATFDEAGVLGELACAAADALGATESPTQLVLGDGADWIKHQARRHFPAAIGILDWPHLARVILRAVRAAQPEGAPTGIAVGRPIGR